MAISKRIRFEVLRRDDHTCRYCGASAPDVQLTVDHVNPIALGGADTPSNLVASCADCNAGKSSSTPDAALVEQVDADAWRWSAAMTEAARRLQAEHDALRSVLCNFELNWTQRLPHSWTATVSRLYESGLPESVLIECADIALAAWGVDSRWAYFCGAANRRLARMQEIAANIIKGES